MKKAILLVHGMGKHLPPKNPARGAFGKEFVDATTATLQKFQGHKSDKFENHVDLHEFNYDAWFEEMRTEMADNAKAMDKRLTAINKIYGASIPLDFAATLTGLEQKFGSDEFFYTHWLDVIFYGTMLGGKVRVDAGAKIAGLVEDYGLGNVHIIAHSLGTAVIHDTLAKLYRPASDPTDEVPDLHPVNHRLGSLWMFANVSRLVNSITKMSDPLKSVVKPGPGGCLNSFFNVHHKLDPFTWLARFDPANDGAWVPGSIYASRYNDIATELLVEVNTHSFPRYLQDPKVIPVLLPYLLDEEFKGTFAEVQQVCAEYSANSLNEKYADLEAAFKDIKQSPAELQDWDEFINAAKTFKNAVIKLGGKF